MDNQGPLLSLSTILLFHVVTIVFADDSDVMNKLLAGLSSAPSGWSSKSNYCNWDGISCDSSSRVTSISLRSRSLSGTIPDLSSLSQLQTISLQGNSLSGPMPSFANLANLEEIYIDYNNFTSIPSGAFKGLTALKTLSISYNLNFPPWTFPSDLKQSTSLETLYAASTSITGSLPDWLGSSFASLQNVRLSYNNLTGPLPASLGGSSIKNFWLNNQNQGLSGTIDVLSTMANLIQVWLHQNQFTGPIPDLSKCGALFDLQLRNNELTGVVPAGLMSLTSLKNVSLDHNNLQGPMPNVPNNMKVTYDFNNFCKTDPGPCDPQVMILLQVAAALGYPIKLANTWQGNSVCSWSFITCQGNNVTTVKFSKQNFTGTISPAFANLTWLRSLSLNDNDLTGTIPQSLATLPHLEVLDMSNNNLSGLIPVFPPSVKLNTTGNPFIGKDLTSGNSGTSKKALRGSSVGLIVGIIMVVLFLIGIALFLFYKYVYSKKRHGKSMKNNNIKYKFEDYNNDGFGREPHHPGENKEDNDFPNSESGNILISIELIRQVTDNFSDENILGKGGFGTVYKGVLQDGLVIAVKRMESIAMSDKGLNEFQAEIAVLTKVRHRHLVAFLGYCINANERILVYEYMPQGTLSQHLFEWMENRYPPLSWHQRVTIALDVARGVEYLHNLAQQSFIHRDLKPSNILLANDMRAKVSDFGLVKHAPDGKYSVETRLAGTFGYLAPEYAATGRVTTKVDVFAFGVILMELITGRKALDNTLSDESSHLVPWFRRNMTTKENILKALDRTLDPDDDTLESIRKVAELAGHCTAREPFQRPDMGHAVNVLCPLVDQWRPSLYQVEEEDYDGYGDNLSLSLRQVVQRWQENEGTTSMYSNSLTNYSQTESSIPSKPSGFRQSLDSTDCR